MGKPHILGVRVMSITAHIKEHSILNTPALNKDGNLEAHVLHRKDTLVNLLAVIDAGDGEIAIASDVDSMVVYKDDGSGNNVVGSEYARAGNSPIFVRQAVTDQTVPTSSQVSVTTALALPKYNANLQIALTFSVPVLANWIWVSVDPIAGGAWVPGSKNTQSIQIPAGYSSSPEMQIVFNNIEYTYVSGDPVLKIDFWHESGADRVVSGISAKTMSVKV